MAATAIKPMSAKSDEKEIDEIVTIGLYYDEAKLKDSKATTSFIAARIQEIHYIQEKIKSEAETFGKKPPIFVLSVLLVPDWNNASGYKEAAYVSNRQNFMDLFEKQVRENTDFKFQDAIRSANNEDLRYLDKVKNNGTNLDWVKTRAIISNTHVKHLQLDCNTLIINYKDIYEQTFGQKTGQDVLPTSHLDRLNASAYDEEGYFVSAHNKVVYTVPNGKIGTAIKSVFAKHLKEFPKAYEKLQIKKPNDAKALKNKNIIYNQVFCKSLKKIGLISKVKPENNKTVYYVANFNNPEYNLTRNIITVPNMTWANPNFADPHRALKDVPALQYTTKFASKVNINFACFLGLIRVHTSAFEAHDGDRKVFEEIFRKKLHDKVEDGKIIKTFYEYIKKNYSHLLSQLVNTIPLDALGKQLCQDVFKVKLDDLRAEASKISAAVAASAVKTSIAATHNPNGKSGAVAEVGSGVFANMSAALSKLEDDSEKLNALRNADMPGGSGVSILPVAPGAIGKDTAVNTHLKLTLDGHFAKQVSPSSTAAGKGRTDNSSLKLNLGGHFAKLKSPYKTAAVGSSKVSVGTKAAKPTTDPAASGPVHPPSVNSSNVRPPKDK